MRVFWLVPLFGFAACGGTPLTSGRMGGSGTGGGVSTGGVPGVGGGIATGGIVGSGGPIYIGGANGTGGVLRGTGGTPGTGGGLGGSSTGTGGRIGVGGAPGGGGATASAAWPCDIYAADGGPCVAAHSTVRALYAAYSGSLYQVKRTDGTIRDIGVLAPGGFASASDQDAFCGTDPCTISIIYDQSGRGNHLTKAGPGGAKKTPDNEAKAAAVPITIGGQRVYGVHITPGIGYRNNQAVGTATGDKPETIYMVTSGDFYNGGCCFDYGNAETNSMDNGEGTVEAVYFGNCTIWNKGAGNGPWVMADLENGLWAGNTSPYEANTPVTFKYVSAMVKGDKEGANHWAIKAGNAQSGSLATMFDGPRPNSRYSTMRKEGAIILGIAGDNSNAAQGNFFEGVMTGHYSSDTADAAVQASIVAARYGVAGALGTGGAMGTGGARGTGGVVPGTGGAVPGTGGASGGGTGTGGRSGTGGAAGSGGATFPASGPCDIYAADGGPCVAAHSTVRALYAAYNGSLYQVKRADGTTKDIGVLVPGGFARSLDQEAFCGSDVCTISVIYDQSGKGNHLTKAPPGGAKKTPGNEAKAAALPVTIGGHKVYGVHVTPGVGYRNNLATGTATGDDAETLYMVTSGDYYNGGCCFDYGNAETNSMDNGEGTVEAVYFGNCTIWGKGAGNGPWVMADLENGLWAGNVSPYEANTPVTFKYVTGMVKGDKTGANHWTIKVGDGQSGRLATPFDGPRPSPRYNPMRKEGAILLGTAGDNSNGAQGNFFEGVMTTHYSSNAADDAVQADIVAAGYGAASTGGVTGTGGGLGAGGAGGAGGSPGSGGSVTALSSTRALGTLTTAEATQLCNDTYAYFDSTIPRTTTCKWKGLSYAVSSSAPTETILRQSCTSQETACLAASPNHPSCGTLPATCTATVGQYSLCISDRAAVFNQATSGLPSCATLTQSGLVSVWDVMTADPPASCMSLGDQCPQLNVPIPGVW